MNKVLTWLIVMSLTGCSAYRPFRATDVDRTRVVTWKTVDDVDVVCRSMMDKQPLPYPLTEVQGCALYGRMTCTIYTNKNTNLHVLGHEVRHCFDGAFHE